MKQIPHSRSFLVVALLALAPGQLLAQDAADACAKFLSATVPAQPVVIRYGLTGGGEEPLALLWADKERYPNHGRYYKLEPKVYTANDRMTAVRAGQLDAGSISLTALVTAVRADFDLRAVASIVETNESDNQGAFVALKESAIRDLKQLKGKRVAFYGPNTISEYWLVSALRRAGLGRNDVTYVSLPPPAQEQALRNRQIDVAWLARQFLAKANEAGGIDIVMRPIQATGQAHPSTLAFFTRKFVAAHPEAFCAWRKDYQQALDDWKRNRESRYAVLVNASYLTPMAAKAGPDGGRSDGGKVDLQDVDKTLRDMVESGFLPSAKGMAAEGLLLKGFALQR